MRLVFVNHCHPATPHVCATRVARMADACASLGHQVVLLTETLEGHPPSISPDRLVETLVRHDWRQPLLVDCPPIGGKLAASLREGQMPRIFRRPLLAGLYVLRHGLFTDWRAGTKPYLRQLAKHFRPQGCWGSFGNTDAWLISRSLARLSHCRWVADLKDPWSVFIPPPLRRFLAEQFSDADAFTALSHQHGADVARWFGRTATTVYSGVDEEFLPPPPPPPPGPTRLLLLGALYDDAHLTQLTNGLRLWDRPATLVYAGSEATRLRQILGNYPLETPGYLDLADLRRMAANCHATLYVRNPRALYQHKLIELLSFDRPTLCLPEESDESLVIAKSLKADFHSCRDAQSLATGLTDTVGRITPIDRHALANYTWQAQAQRLLEVLA